MKTAVREICNWGDFLKRLEQMYPIHETDLSVRTEIEELPSLPEFPTAARISEFVVQLEELMGRMNPTLNLHRKCLQAAAVDVKLLEEA